VTAEQNAQSKPGGVLFYAIVLLLVYALYRVFEPFLAALAWAVVIVVVSHPAYDRLARRWSASTAAAASTAGVTMILVVPALLVAFVFVRQGVEAVQSVQAEAAAGHFAWLNRLWVHWQERFPAVHSVDLAAALRGYGEQAVQFFAERLAAIVRQTAGFLLDLAMMILAMFYLYRDGHSILERLRHLLPLPVRERDQLLGTAREMIFATVASSFAAAVVHGVLGGVAMAVAGVRAPLFWGVMMGFLSLIPFFGAALIWLPASIGLALEGHMARGILLAAFCAIVVGMVDNVVRPWFISGRSRVSGLLVFVGVLGGISAFGMLGLVLGPIVVTMAATLLELYAGRALDGNTPPEAIGKNGGAVLE